MNGPVNEVSVRRTSSKPSSAVDFSVEASRRAAAILEVLAGQRTAAEAAAALGICVNHYYLLERKSLQGLTAACEAQPKGPKGPGLEVQVQALQRDLEQCQRECMRQTALVRATQRAIGLASVPEPAKTSGKKPVSKGKGARKTRKRRPAVRALRAARDARKNSSSQKLDVGLEKTLAGPCATDTGASGTTDSPHVKEHLDGTQG